MEKNKNTSLIKEEDSQENNIKNEPTILESPMMHLDEGHINKAKLLKTHSDTTSNFHLKAEENFFKKAGFPIFDANQDTINLHTPIKLTREPSIADSNSRKCSSVDLEKNLDLEEELKNL